MSVCSRDYAAGGKLNEEAERLLGVVEQYWAILDLLSVFLWEVKYQGVDWQ